MDFPLDEHLPERLAARLSQPLPGRQVQAAFSHEMSYGRHFGPAPDRRRNAAVLVLLRWDGDQWLVPLTRRPQGPGIHSGQICCVGGGIDAGETVVEAALRECREEVGWAPTELEVVGQLSPLFVYASNNLVSSVVAASTATPRWRLDSREVAELLELPLQHLCHEDAIGETTIVRHGITTRAACYCWQDVEIWGATSMILAELVAVITGVPRKDPTIS